MRTSQIFTGNENATELVGMRLKRLTPNYALEILQSDSNPLIENKQREFKNLCEGLGIKNLLDLSKTTSMTKDHGSDHLANLASGALLS